MVTRFFATLGFCLMLFGAVALLFHSSAAMKEADRREAAERVVHEREARRAEILGQLRVREFQERNHCILLDDCVQKVMAATK